MFSSLSFAPKTTEMGKSSICDFELVLIEENESVFIMPENAITTDGYHCNELISITSNQNSSYYLENDPFQDEFSQTLIDDAQEVLNKNQSFLDHQQKGNQYLFTNNFHDLNLIEENFSNKSLNFTKLIDELMLKKIKCQNFILPKEYLIEEEYKPTKIIFENENPTQKENSLNSTSIISIPDIEEYIFDDYLSGSLDFTKKILEAKINFELKCQSPAMFLPRIMPKLSFPYSSPKQPSVLSSMQMSEEYKQDNHSKIPQSASGSPQNSFDTKLQEEKCSKSSQTEDNVKSASKNRLFPASSKSVTPLKASTDTRKALIIDERLISLPGFQQTFADYRIIFRALKACDMEINERTCIIFRPLITLNGAHKHVKNFRVSHDQLTQALTLFEKVFLVISLENELKQYDEISESNKRLLSHIYGNKINVQIRQFPTNKSAFNFIHSLVDDSQKFLRDCESLHEHLLSLFPTISKSLAQAILMKGNPIIDCSISIDEFPKINIVPFKQVLDSISETYKANKARRGDISEDKNNQLPYATESESQPLYVSGNKKIIAPFPSSIPFSNEI